MKKILILTAVCILIMVLIGYTKKKEKPEMPYKQISQQEAHEKMLSENGYIILDVRTPEEFKGGHIPNAVCVPVETIGQEDPKELPDKDQLILVYCRSGNRSKQAAKKLAALGYSNIEEFGGINTWKYEVTTE